MRHEKNYFENNKLQPFSKHAHLQNFAKYQMYLLNLISGSLEEVFF